MQKEYLINTETGGFTQMMFIGKDLKEALDKFYEFKKDSRISDQEIKQITFMGFVL